MSNQEKKIIEEDDIDLLELAKVLWNRRGFILKVTGVFVILGLVIAFTAKVEYEASCKLLPESQQGGVNLGKLGGLAGLAGFDLSGLSTEKNTLSPRLYPEIIKSTPLIDLLINTPVYFENKDTTITSFQYFESIDRPSLIDLLAEYTIRLPGKIKKLLIPNHNSQARSYDMIRYSKDDWKILESFADRLMVSIDVETGTISIVTEMPDPVAAASINQMVVDFLTQEIVSHNIEKATINLEFVKERFEESKNEYQSKQNQLASFVDNNRNITTSLYQTEVERLQNEMDIAFEVYKGLASQLEQAKIQVKQDTPIFTILEPVRIPEDKSKPRRGLILVVLFLLGLITSGIYSILTDAK